MASAWQSVLSVHQWIVENGGMITIIFFPRKQFNLFFVTNSYLSLQLTCKKTFPVYKTGCKCVGVRSCRCALQLTFTMTALWPVTCCTIMPLLKYFPESVDICEWKECGQRTKDSRTPFINIKKSKFVKCFMLFE